MVEPRTAHVVLKLPAGKIEVDLVVPAGPTRVDEILPLARALTDQIVDLTVTQLEKSGRTVSCRAGCGACCRQLVPIGEAEARAIADLVASFPEPRRSTVLARFAESLDRLDNAGLLDLLGNRANWDEDQRGEIGITYFRLGIACPFLEDESCSIHSERPIACREYLVTSPPERCANPRADQVEGVKLPSSVWTAVASLEPVEPGVRLIPWVPLSLALDWAESHRAPPAEQPAPELVRRLFDNITRKRDRSPSDPAEGGGSG